MPAFRLMPIVLTSAALVACTNDFDAFQFSDATSGTLATGPGGAGGITSSGPAGPSTGGGGLAGGGGSAGKGGSAGAGATSGGAGGTGGGSVGGAAGAGGGCSAGEKLCGGSCVSTADPSFGCSAPTCDLCVAPNATPACSGGVCAVGSCNPGFGDCNVDPADGCEIDLSADPQHCGTCATVCAVANGAPICSGGNCAIASCNAPFQDCDGQYADGCETNTSTSVGDCGSCGRACSSANVASLSCSGGLCDSTCDLGFANCAAPSAPTADDGCELNVLANNANCGGCGNACSLQGGATDQFECDKGPFTQKICGCSNNNECRMAGAGGTCNTNLGLCSCNGNLCDPSEACMKVGGVDTCSCNGGAACAIGAVCCGSPAGCKDLATDASSCGACGHACPAGFTCASAGCRCSGDASCNAGTAGSFSCNGGLCVCEATTCATGERCQPNGSCG